MSESLFDRMKAADPDLALRADAIFREVREAAADDLRAIRLSEQLTVADFAVTINARADDMP